MATTQKLPSGSWRCRLYVNGVQRSFTAPTKKEAEQKAYSYLEEHPVPSADMTVQQALLSYIGSKSAVISPTTVVGYKNIARNHLAGIREKKISKVTQVELQAEINEEAKQYSPKTVKNIVGLLVPTFAMFGIPLGKITTPQKAEKEIVIPTDDEIRLLCDNAERYRVKTPVYLAAFMGLRRSEIAGLDLDRDYDEKKHVLHVREAVVIGEGQKLARKAPKSKSSTRTLPVPTLLQKMLAEREKMPSPGIIENRFIDMRDALGLKHIRFHALRHYYASTLIVLGVPDFYAVKLMGHGSDQMLKTVYQHVRKDYLSDVAARVDSFLSKFQK